MSTMAFPTKFNGDKREFPKFEEMILFRAQSVSMPFRGGLLGFILPTARWESLPWQNTANPVAFAPLAHPGPKPAIPQDAAQLPLYNVAWERWTDDFKQFQAQEKEVLSFKTALIDALGDEPCSRLQHPVHGFREFSLQDIFVGLLREYSTLSTTDIRKNIDILTQPLGLGGNIRAYTATHNKIHEICAANNQMLSEFQKTEYLRRGVQHVPTYKQAIDAWLLRFPALADQTFVTLSTQLHQASDNEEIKAISPSTEDHGYVASVTAASSTVPVSRDHLLHMFEQFLLTHSAAAVSAPPSAQSKKLKRPKRKDLYCFTHGQCAHTSAECNKPGPAHQRGADARNPLHKSA